MATRDELIAESFKELKDELKRDIKDLGLKIDQIRETYREELRREFDVKLKEQLVSIRITADQLITLQATVRIWGSILGTIGSAALIAAISALMRTIVR